MDLHQLQEHENWYKNQMAERQKSIHVPNESAVKYVPIKTKAYEKILVQQKEAKEAELKREEDLLNRLKTRKQYAELIKEQFRPALNNSLLKSKSLSREDQSKEKKKRPVMFRYYLKKSSKHEDSQGNQSLSKEADSSLLSDSTKFKPRKGAITSRSHDAKNAKPQHIDYLKQFIEKRNSAKLHSEDNEKEAPAFERKGSWHKYLSNEQLSWNERCQCLILSVHRLENKARLKENFIDVDQELQHSAEVSNLYVSSIKAKLALLDKIQEYKSQ